MSRSGAPRAIDIAALLLGASLPAAALAAVRALPSADLPGAGLGWVAPSIGLVVAVVSSLLGLVCLVAGLRGGGPAALSGAVAAAAIAGGGLALALTSQSGGLVMSLPLAAMLVLVACLTLTSPVAAGRRTRILLVLAGLVLAEGAVLAGIVPAMQPVTMSWQAPLLLGAMTVAALAALVARDRWLAVAAAALAFGATGILLDRGGGLELVIGLLALVAAPASALRALPRRDASHDAARTEPALPALAHHLSDAVLHFDGGLRLCDWNASAAALLGLDRHSSGTRLEDLLGVPIAQLPTLDGASVAASTAVGALEIRLHRSGEGVVAVVSGSPARADDDRLGRELRGTIEELLQARRTIELQRAEIERTSTVDLLTGVASRSAILDRLRIEIAQARRYQHAVAVVLLDVDGFADINHRHGIGGGDALLREVALRMRLRVREADALGRAGSDGFLAILPHTDEAGAAAFAGALRQRLAQRPVPVGQELVPLTVSIGVAVMRSGEDLDLDGMLTRVGEALDSARRAGGDRIALDRDHGFIRLGSDRDAGEPDREREAT